MSSHGFDPITPLSAAYTLVLWIQDHGREPHKSEARPCNGLLSYMTYYRHLPGETFSAIVSYALELVASLPPVSAALAHPPRRCLKCDTTFPYEGPQVAFCAPCRRARRQQPTDGSEEDVFLEQRQLWPRVRQSLGSSWVDDVDWRM